MSRARPPPRVSRVSRRARTAELTRGQFCSTRPTSQTKSPSSTVAYASASARAITAAAHHEGARGDAGGRQEVPAGERLRRGAVRPGLGQGSLRRALGPRSLRRARSPDQPLASWPRRIARRTPIATGLGRRPGAHQGDRRRHRFQPVGAVRVRRHDDRLARCGSWPRGGDRLDVGVEHSARAPPRALRREAPAAGAWW